MPDLHDLLEREANGYAPPGDLLDRVRGRRRQRDRNRRATTGMAALVLVVAMVAGVANIVRRPDTAFTDTPPDAFAGTWVSIDTDGSAQTMHVRPLADGRYDVVINDDMATVCQGARSIIVGAARPGDGAIVMPAPTLTCDDDSDPVVATVNDDLRNYTLTYDGEAETLSDSLSVLWYREGAPRPEPSGFPASDEMWPQSTLSEVREAQQQADAGDPEVAWQVIPGIVEETTPPGSAPIFTRYLQQVLGWESFRWGDRVGLTWDAECATAGCTSHTIGFVRCATSQPNPLYPKDGMHGDVPDDADGSTCAPTNNDSTYETVTLTARQPLQKGTTAIWVISDAVATSPFRQEAPLSEAEVAAAVEPFLQARVETQNAKRHLQQDSRNVPLLYAASNGAKYTDFDYELTGPLWPHGIFDVKVRLFADARNRVVEQEFMVSSSEPALSYPMHATWENGTPVAVPRSAFDGRMTYAADPAWDEFFFDIGRDASGLYYTKDNGLDRTIVVIGDPVAPTGPCAADGPAESANALAESVQSNRNLNATRPVPTRIGAIDGIRMDVTMAEGGAAPCEGGWLADEAALVVLPRPGEKPIQAFGAEAGHRTRLYLFDLPGKPATVAIMVSAPEADFEETLDLTAPIMESFEVQGD